MDIALFWSLFIILAITYFAIAMSAQGAASSDEDFFYGRRKFGVISTTLSLSAIQIGGGLVLATSDEAYRFGPFGIAYSLGVCGGFLVLASGLAYRFKKLNINTIVEIFSIKYNSLRLRYVASILSIIALLGILISQIVASRKLLNSITGENHWILIVFWLAVIAYTMFGGLRAIVATQIFQIGLVFVVFTGIFVMYWWKQPLSFALFKDPKLWFKQNAVFENPPFIRLLGLFLVPLFYSLFAQDLGQRFFSARTPLVASISALFAAIIVFCFSLVPVIFGMEARALGIQIKMGHSAMFALFETIFSPFFFYLAICAVIAAISSTADAVLCAIGSNVLEDFLLTSRDGPIDDHLALLISRLIILITGIFSLIFAYQIDNILRPLQFSYDLAIACLLIPISFGLILKKPKTKAAVFAMLGGFSGFVLFSLFSMPMFAGELMALPLSMLGYIVGHFYQGAD